MGPVQHFIEYDLQAIALATMALLYTIKAVQLSRLPMPWERAEARGSAASGVLLSYATIFMPWAMESSRTHMGRWLEFALYHIAALVAIVNTFTFPFAPSLMTDPVRLVFALLIAPALPIGFIKLYRRWASPELRLVSTPDDYFSLITLQLFFGTAIGALLLDTAMWRSTYFLITALFLFYVPFSKISHYIYFFFARFLTGSRYGTRGVLPRSGGAR